MKSEIRKLIVMLPRLEQAVIPPAKLTGYLLSDTHPEGASKAAFFQSFGYNAVNWEAFAVALAVHAHEHEVAAVESSDFGTRYTIEGAIDGADGWRPLIRAIWFIDSGSGNSAVRDGVSFERSLQ